MSFISVANFSHLSAHLNLLDVELARIRTAIKSSNDPDNDGLFDRGEYFIGHGFIAIQTYIASAYPQTGVKKVDALKVPPMVKNDLTLVAAINAGANYYKHLEEWGLEKVVTRDVDALSGQAMTTIKTIEKITPWSDYTCANLLADLLGSDEIELSTLLPKIIEWHNNLMELTQ